MKKLVVVVFLCVFATTTFALADGMYSGGSKAECEKFVKAIDVKDSDNSNTYDSVKKAKSRRVSSVSRAK